MTKHAKKSLLLRVAKMLREQAAAEAGGKLVSGLQHAAAILESLP